MWQLSEVRVLGKGYYCQPKNWPFHFLWGRLECSKFLKRIFLGFFFLILTCTFKCHWCFKNRVFKNLSMKAIIPYWIKNTVMRKEIEKHTKEIITSEFSIYNMILFEVCQGNWESFLQWSLVQPILMLTVS